MGFFRKKLTRDQLIKEIKTKKGKIDKLEQEVRDIVDGKTNKKLEVLHRRRDEIKNLKEEIIKMGKLAMNEERKFKLKGGKLEPVDSEQPADEQQPAVEQPVTEQPVAEQQTPVPESVQQIPIPEPEDSQQIQQPQPMNVPEMQVVQEPQMPVMPVPPVMPPFGEAQPQIQQPVQQPQQPNPLPVDNVSVRLEMVENKIIDIDVPQQNLQGFLREVSEAIDNQSSVQIGSGLVNGRHIINCICG